MTLVFACATHRVEVPGSPWLAEREVREVNFGSWHRYGWQLVGIHDVPPDLADEVWTEWVALTLTG